MTKKPAHNNNKNDLRMRQSLAQEAARLISEEGIKDFNVAKHKAAERLHAPHTHNLPRNIEIQAALNQYQRIFKADTQPQKLHQLRQTSLKAMQLFQKFEPRLTGAVLDGTANEFSEINLHLFAGSSKEVSLFLLNSKIPFEQCSQNISMPNGEYKEVPGFQLEMDGASVLLVVFNHNDLRQPPRCPTTGKPMQRYGLSKVEELVQLSPI